MSGGAFNYAYARAEYMANELRDMLAVDSRTRLENGEAKWRPETIQALHDVVSITEVASKMMKEAEWLYSYDTSEDTFLSRVQRIKNEAKTLGVIA